MIATILGLLFSKAGVYLGLLAGGAGVLFVTHRSGVLGERANELERVVSDRDKADKIAADTARVHDARAVLSKEFPS